MTTDPRRAPPSRRCDPDDELECPRCQSLAIGDSRIRRDEDGVYVVCLRCTHLVAAPTRSALLDRLRAVRRRKAA